MGYTFYLPFAVYVGGLLCWSYTVMKLLMIGRLAGYGIGLMFIAGYALLFSNLTLMVVLGVILLTLDRVKPTAAESLSVATGSVLPATDGLVHGQA
jgi:predicted lipid-binding transport protein (Tim44 family)